MPEWTSKEMKLADATDGLGMRKATARLVKLTSRERKRLMIKKD
jgi:hypothetical protein